MGSEQSVPESRPSDCVCLCSGGMTELPSSIGVIYGNALLGKGMTGLVPRQLVRESGPRGAPSVDHNIDSVFRSKSFGFG